MNDADQVAGFQGNLTGTRDEPLDPGVAADLPGTSAPELKSLLGLAVGMLIIAALYFGKEVLVPITLAVMLSFVLSPVVNFLQRMCLWRAPAVILSVLIALALLAIVGTVIASQAASLSANAPQYAQTIETKVRGAQGFAIAKLAALTKLGSPIQPAPVSTSGAQGSRRTAASQPSDGSRPIPAEAVQGPRSPFAIAQAVLAPIMGPLETTFLVLIVAIFVLMQKEDLRDRFIRLFGSNDLHRTTRAIDDAGQRLSKYFLSQLAVNACFGFIISLGLWAIGIPSPFMWGLMAGLLRFVPYIGSLLAAVAPAALGAAIDPGWGMAIEVIALFLVIETLTGYFVEPMLYGRSTGLSPVSVIVSAIFWTWVWGPIGLILSTPLTLCLVVMGRHVKSLEFFDVLLGDRPALTPIETFYQRILANNPDEALAQAEGLLGDRTLVDYFDEVVLPSLRLAVEDQAKGTIDAPKAHQMKLSISSVIEDLDGRVEVGPDKDQTADPPTAPGLVACVAGSGPFDALVSTMLAQLLEQRGMPSRKITNGMTSRASIARLDLAGVEVIAISYLELVGAPAELRYLIKRLRQRSTTAKVIVGLWPQGEAALADPAIQQAVGANRYVGSLDATLDAVQNELQATSPRMGDSAGSAVVDVG